MQKIIALTCFVFEEGDFRINDILQQAAHERPDTSTVVSDDILDSLHFSKLATIFSQVLCSLAMAQVCETHFL